VVWRAGRGWLVSCGMGVRVSVLCSLGIHSWKPQYIRLPYSVSQYVAAFMLYEYSSKNFLRGYRCKRCRKWEESPKLPPPDMRPNQAAIAAQQKEQQNKYMSAMATGDAQMALNNFGMSWGGNSHQNGCRCCCNKGAW